MTPKWFLACQGFASAEAYARARASRDAEKRRKPGPLAARRIGPFSGWTYRQERPMDALDMTTFFESEKLLYDFEYRAGGRAAEDIMRTLREFEPHDEAPPVATMRKPRP